MSTEASTEAGREISTGAMPGVPAAITAETEAFWAAGVAGALTVEECAGCGMHIFPPRGVCRRCYGRDLHLVPVAGPGVIAAETVNHNAWSPGGPAVYTVVLVEFLEYSGARFIGTFDDSAGPARVGDLVDFDLVPAFERRFQLTFRPRSAR